MLHRNLIYLSALLLTGSFAHAQFGVIQDTEGRNSLYLPHGTLALDLAGEQLKFNQPYRVSEHLTLHPNLNVKAAGGKTIWFSPSPFTFNGAMGLSLVYKLTIGEDNKVYVYYNGNLSRARVNLWNLTSSSITRRNINHGGNQLGITLNPHESHSFMSIGAAFNQADNLGQMQAAEFTSSQATFNGNAVNTILVKEKALGPANTLLANINQTILLADYLYTTGMIGYQAHFRYVDNHLASEKPYVNLGGGVYVNPNTSRKFQGGLVLDVIDAAGVNTSESFTERLRLAVVAGYSL